MADKKLRIGVVGAGHVAQIAHLPAYKSHPDVELAALAEEDPLKGRKLVQQYGIGRYYEDLTDMLRKEELDGIDICTPNYLHAPMAITALRSGLHVLCEKPLARNATEAQKMVDAAKENKKILMVAMNNRFRTDVQILRDFVRKGELGDVQLVKAGWLRTAQSWHEHHWLKDEHKSGGGALLDLGLPIMDLAVWIAGLKKPVRVTCSLFGRVGKNGVEESACALVNFTGGSCLMLEVTWNFLEPKDHSYLQVFGGKGGGNLHPFSVHKAMRGQLVNVTPTLDGRRNYYKESYKEEIYHFIECIQKRRTPLTTGEEAMSVLKILDAMYKSASSGREVRFGR
jgi:predicted dehydrogenase